MMIFYCLSFLKKKKQNSFFGVYSSPLMIHPGTEMLDFEE